MKGALLLAYLVGRVMAQQTYVDPERSYIHVIR